MIDEATIARLRDPEPPKVEPGFCGCGCGERTTRHTSTDKRRGRMRGEYARFLTGHRQRLPTRTKKPLVGSFDERDCGYESPCWIWNREINRDGYGMGSLRGVRTSAHRIIYERLRGAIPAGLQLDHLCSVRACMNPDHVEVVTAAENMQRGGNAKLTAEDVAAIRASNDDAASLAAQYGMSAGWVRRIRQGYGWGDPIKRRTA